MKEIVNQIEMSRIKLLWEIDRWDVMLSGILKLDDERMCFFKRAHHPVEAEEGRISYEDKEYKRYDIYSLSAQEIEHELSVHNDFVKYVGGHTDIIDNDPNSQKKNLHLVKYLEESKEFYDKYPNEDQSKYTNNEYLGSFYL